MRARASIGKVGIAPRANTETAEDIWMLGKDGEPQPFVVTRFREWAPRFSPDGRFLAYVSNESGRHEVSWCARHRCRGEAFRVEARWRAVHIRCG
ncbi:MAG: hypothetical protein E2P02_02050 [Acidobacteria bacterium]|nr:MAG: hypothetical protein E2P02_02050 [Acidobacteriota bacterium]